MAERVGFGLRPPVENKRLTGFPLPPDPPEPLESRDGRTYCARGAIYKMYTAPFLNSLRPSLEPTRPDGTNHCEPEVPTRAHTSNSEPSQWARESRAGGCKSVHTASMMTIDLSPKADVL